MSDLCIAKLFDTQCSEYGEKVALVLEDGTRSLSYQDLQERANSLGAIIQSILHPENFLNNDLNLMVSILTNRNVGLIVAILSVLKAGATYVPVDPSFPPDRQSYIFSHSKSKLLLVDQEVYVNALTLGVKLPPTLVIDSEGFPVVTKSQDHTKSKAVLRSFPSNGTRLAYVLYTSGSTGKPKGVMVMHQGVINVVRWFTQELKLTPQSVVLGLTTYCFDISVLEMFLPLLSGAQLVIADSASQKDPFRLLDVISSRGVTVVQATPTTFEMMLATGWKGDESIHFLVGGEAFRPSLLPLVTHSASLRNVYGPTETTIWSSSYNFCGKQPNPEKLGNYVIPIGQPISETEFYLVEVDVGVPPWQLVGEGGEGELWIGGAGVARGYIHAPDLTEQRFLQNPFLHPTDPPTMVYRTGDLCRRLEDGNYVFIRRLDDQVKVNGYRIELAEIEVVLQSFPTVEQAVVVVRDGQLVAYVKAVHGAVLEKEQIEELRAFSSRTLTHYMLPRHIVVVTSFPQTANGKLDRNALPSLNIPHETKEDDAGAGGDGGKGEDRSECLPVDDCTMVRHVSDVCERLKGFRPKLYSSFVAMGIDSLGSILFLKTLSDSLGGLRIDVKTVFDPDVTLLSLSVVLFEKVRESNPEVLARLRIHRASNVTAQDVEAPAMDGNDASNRVESIDQRILASKDLFEGIRGLLMLMVLWEHSKRGQQRLALAFSANTSMFVLLTGFTTALQLRQSRGSMSQATTGGDGPYWKWVSFVISRAVGLYPMLWFSLLLAIPQFFNRTIFASIVHKTNTPLLSKLCPVLYVTGMQTWVRDCSFYGPYEMYYASVIINCFLLYSAFRFILHFVQYRIRRAYPVITKIGAGPIVGDVCVWDETTILSKDSPVGAGGVPAESCCSVPCLVRVLLQWAENNVELKLLPFVLLIMSGFIVLMIRSLKNGVAFGAYFASGVVYAAFYENIFNVMYSSDEMTARMTTDSAAIFFAFFPDVLSIAIGITCMVPPKPSRHYDAREVDRWSRYLIVPVVFGWVLVLVTLQWRAVRGGLTRRLVELPFIRAIGYASYPIYLLHQLLLNYYARIIDEQHGHMPDRYGYRWWKDEWFSRQPWYVKFIGWLCVIAVCLPIQRYFQDGLIASIYSRITLLIMGRKK